jgi:hypothetical protein
MKLIVQEPDIMRNCISIVAIASGLVFIAQAGAQVNQLSRGYGRVRIVDQNSDPNQLVAQIGIAIQVPDVPSTLGRNDAHMFEQYKLDVFNSVIKKASDVSLLAPIAADILKRTKDEIVTGQMPRNSDSQKMYISPELTTTPNGIELVFYFRPNIKQREATEIARRTLEQIAPLVRDLSRKALTEVLQPALESAEKSLVDGHRSIQSLRNRLNELSTNHELPAEKLIDRLADLQQQRMNALLALDGMDARQKAIEEQIALTKARIDHDAQAAQQNGATAEMIATLKDLVKLRTANLDRLNQLRQSGVAPQSEFDDASAKLLEAKIQLLSLQSSKEKNVGGEQINALTNELTKIAIDRAEMHARSDSLSNMTAETKKQLADRTQVDQVIKSIEPELATKTKEVGEIEPRVERLKAAVDNFEPLDIAIPPSNDDGK